MSEQLQSRYGESLLERVKHHGELFEGYRMEYYGQWQRDREDHDPLPENVRTASYNVASAFENVIAMLGKMEAEVEKSNAIQPDLRCAIAEMEAVQREREAERPPMSDLAKHVFDTTNAINRFAVEQLRAEREAAPEEVNHA